MNNHDDVLQRIARYLMLHSSFTNNIGLLNGKMGVVLFFMNYARYTNNKRYEKFAGELIDEIYNEIRIDCSRSFGDGLAGIAWGMEYLIRNQFVKANPDEVLEELDIQILERDVRRVKDCSLESGLKGIAYYTISRCAGRHYPPVFKDYIDDLIYVLKKMDTTDEEILYLVNHLMNIIYSNENAKYTDFLTSLISETNYRNQSVFNEKRALGLSKNGYTGIGLKLIMKV